MSSPLSRSGLRREQSVFALSSPDVVTISSGSVERVALETEVLELLLSEELVPEQAATSEVRWFFRNLGLHSAYFHAQPASKIAEHVLALYASKLLAACSGSESSVLSLRLKHETAEGALYIVPSTPGADSSPSEMVERRIEAFYYDEPYAAFALEDLPPFLLPTAVPPVASSSPSTPFSPSTKASPTSHAGYRCAINRTGGTVSPTSEARLRLMLVQRIFDSLSPELEQETDLRKVSKKYLPLSLSIISGSLSIISASLTLSILTISLSILTLISGSSTKFLYTIYTSRSEYGSRDVARGHAIVGSRDSRQHRRADDERRAAESLHHVPQGLGALDALGSDAPVPRSWSVLATQVRRDARQRLRGAHSASVAAQQQPPCRPASQDRKSVV